MNIRKAEPDDFKMLANIHSLAFSGFFLTSLGINFLQTYYKAVLNSQQSIAVCVLDDSGVIQGFATGTIRANGYHRKLFKNNLLSFISATFIAALTKPSVIIRLVKNLDKNHKVNDNKDYAELLSIAVMPQMKGTGVPQKLLNYFESEVLKRGGQKIALTTDYHNNDRVVAFYNKCGYEVFYDFVTYPDRRMYKMIKTLSGKC